METTRVKELNIFRVNFLENGDVFIESDGKEPYLTSILIVLAGIAMIVIGLLIESELRYVLWVFGGAFVLLGAAALISCFIPKTTYLNKADKTIIIKSKYKTLVIKAHQIKQLRYRIDSTSAATSGIGPEIRFQNVMMEFENGDKSIELFPLMRMTSGLTSTYEEQAHGDELMRIVRDVIGVRIKFAN